MFDDPKKELKRLEEELLAVENSDEAFERFYSEIYDEFGKQKGTGDLTDDLPVRKKPAAAAVQRQPAPSAQNAYDDQSSYVPRTKNEKGVGGLAALVCFECLGIAAIVLWWLLRIL